MAAAKQPIVFISYSHLDEPDQFLQPQETRWLSYVSSHLKPATAHGKLELWDDRRIEGGGDWRAEIEDALNRCAVCVFLVSRHSLSSRFILDVEMKRILERHYAGGAHLYPIVITSCDLEVAPWLLKLNLKPTNGTALERYEVAARNAVMAEIAAEIRRLLIDRTASAPVVPEKTVREKLPPEYKKKNTALFANYMKAQSKRCSRVRTLVYDKQSAYLPDIYIPLRASMSLEDGRKHRLEELTTDDIVNLLSRKRDVNDKSRQTLAILLSAPAGAGKTFFMRHLYMILAASPQSKVPIFLEARELNRTKLTDFPGIVAVAFHTAGQEFSREQAVDGLKVGLFIILIDGFDELRLSHERHYVDILERAAQDFHLCPLLASGRPGEFVGLRNFQHCDIFSSKPQ